MGGAPVRHVLVGVSVGDVEHDDGALGTDADGGTEGRMRGEGGGVGEGGVSGKSGMTCWKGRSQVTIAKTTKLLGEKKWGGGEGA